MSTQITTMAMRTMQVEMMLGVALGVVMMAEVGAAMMVAMEVEIEKAILYYSPPNSKLISMVEIKNRCSHQEPE